MTPDDGPSRESLAAQISALKAVVERQKLYIGSMRASRFWRLRDACFAAKRRLIGGTDPLPVPTIAEIGTEAAAQGDAYQIFRIRERRSIADVDWLRGFVRLFAFRERIDILLDARSASLADLESTYRSLYDQIYPHWRLRIFTDGLDPETLAWAEQLARDEQRVLLQSKLVEIGHLVALCAMGAGDTIEPDALLCIAVELHDGADLVYTDEDRLDESGLPAYPSFKPGWSPETELTRDYVGRLCAIRGPVLADAGGLFAAHGTAMWYDAVLRVTELTDRIAHVPRILYHRHFCAETLSVAQAEAAVRRALDRRHESAQTHAERSGIDVRYAVERNERVTVIIPTRDQAGLLERCVRSLFERTTHETFDVIVVDNGSREPATRELFERWQTSEPTRFRILADNSPFNYSRLNNRAVRDTNAPYILLLNNDTEVISPDWMSRMLGQARRNSVGAVGALLLYEDRSVQHAGVILGGVRALAGHAYRFTPLETESIDDRLLFDTNYLAVTGACLMVSRAKYEEVGGMDEELAVSYNDVDLCLKLCAAGYRNVVVPSARLFHFESKTRGLDDTKAKAAIARAESEAFRKRWPEWSRRDPYYNPNLSLETEDFSVR